MHASVNDMMCRMKCACLNVSACTSSEINMMVVSVGALQYRSCSAGRHTRVR